ncbi:MAG: hypothetical protein FWH06_04725 [Oscillospiraceae bacterium]|nr:hypothetical protein [Oscillospiraceae bacterium]
MAVKNFKKYTSGNHKKGRAGAGHLKRAGRREPGKLLKYVSMAVCAAGWCATLSASAMLNLAKPQSPSIFTAYRNLPLRTYWNVSIVIPAMYILIGVSCACVTMFSLNMLVYKKKPDKVNILTITLAILSLAIIGGFVLRHPSLLF